MRLGYTGSVTRYDTLADAQAGTNAVSTASLGGTSRDFYLSFRKDFGQSAMLLGTDWYLTTTGTSYGAGNPNNTNVGFVQLADNSLTSLTSSSSAWDATRTVFSLNLSGANALDGVHPVYNTRLWNTTADTGQGGTFLSYDFSMVATVADAAAWDSTAGMYVAQTDPTAVTGYFRGVFQNTSEVAGPIGTSQQGFYTFDFSLNLDNWASQHSAEFTPTATLPANQYYVSTLASSIPEPSTYALLLGAGTLALAALRRRARR